MVTVHIEVEDMFDGDVEQFEDCFGGEPGGLTLAGFTDLAARHDSQIIISISPEAVGGDVDV
jgi:hypothetical protein